MTDTDIGTIVDGRYRVISRLGSGGMADVFLAEDQQLGRNVALKLLHRRFSADPGFVERFRREAQAAAGLQHPNVVSVYDRGEFEDTYYIAMEYIPGRTLKQLIRQDAPLDPVRAIDITLQILKATRFAHRRGVIHRDLKPHNVIVGDGDHAKVTDFGIARAGASDMTETGSIMGTAQYLSPEQAQGHAVGETSDLYSIAVVLYEMLTGQVPFDADSAVSIALKHVSEAPPPPRTINPNIPPELEQVVLWGLNKNPDDRPQDADQFINVLEQVRESIVSGTRGQITASMAAVAAATTVPTAVMAADAASAYGAAQRPDLNGNDGTYGDDARGPGGPGRDADKKEGSGKAWPWVLALVLVALLAGGGVAAYLLSRPVKVTVPYVVNESQADATATLSNAGFTPNVLNETSTSPAGTVIRQSPTAFVKADKGSTVTLTVSQGPGQVNVPPVVDLSQNQAKQAITAAGLKVARVLTENSGVVPSGSATRTAPGAGTSVGVGSGVTLFISSGKAPIAVPSVTGDTAAAAKGQLTAAGFNVTQTSQTTNTASQVGTVLSQSPSPPTKAPSGSNVTIVVGTAPTTAAVPNVVGYTAAAAASTLTSAGFNVSDLIEVVNKPNQDGNVISQSPRPGGSVKKGTTVTITVGRYQAPPVTTTTTSTTTTPTTTSTTG